MKKKKKKKEWARYAVNDDKSGKFVIEMSHRLTGEKKYMSAAPAKSPDDIPTFTNMMFDRIEDASRYPYPSEQTALAVILSIPKTRNLDYAVVAAKEKP